MRKNLTNEIVNDIDVEVVKIIGRLKGTSETIELVLDRNIFFEWVGKKSLPRKRAKSTRRKSHP